MDSSFSALIQGLQPSFEKLMACSPVTNGAEPEFGLEKKTEKVEGVYLFSENGSHLYVGRSNHLRRRYRNHWVKTKSEREAAFAFKLARQSTSRVAASYKKGADSRKGLMEDSVFVEAFSQAKARIMRMDYRWVLEPDPTKQCLLEIYVAMVLKTPFNDFDNH